ncbi:hypothetical protein JMUB6875_69590 [Nocardia sp. JMUB6875]|uniref:hypothetical protein n=1 Tax=Nocardia sp. JMUB6875 TaxID=3158170 RepID=UPI0032E6355D
MGARANLVLIDGDGLRLHYSHWAADTIGSVLIGGPDPACRFISAQRLCDPTTEWLDDVWCEGGAVVDLTKRELVYFGDQLLWEVPEKQVYGALLERMWPGWRIRWAYDGIGDLAAASGVDRSVVRRARRDDRVLPEQVTDDLDDPHLLTVRTSQGVTVYPLGSWLHTAWQGPALLDLLPEGGVEQLALTGMPTSGLHIDVDAHTIGVWIGFTMPGLLPALVDLWPGWHIEFWQDRYTEQLTRCGDAIDVPAPPRIETLDAVVEHLGKHLGHNPVDSMLSLVEDLHADSGKVQLNPFFTEHRPVEPTSAEWSAVLHAADQLRADWAA